MRLLSNPASPFARKVIVLAIETGLHDRLEIINQQLTPVTPNAMVASANPLGKIPCLEFADGSVLYDSRVICEYLDSLHDGPKMFPAESPERWLTLRLHALAEGMIEAAVATRYETFLRPERLRWGDWITGQKLKIARALDRLESEHALLVERVDVGAITIACCLGYLDFRFPVDEWRTRRPKLEAWYAGFAERPSMRATIPC